MNQGIELLESNQGPPKLLLPAQQKSQMATPAKRVKESWQNKQPRRRGFANLPDSISKTLEVIFFLMLMPQAQMIAKQKIWPKEKIDAGS